MLLRYLSFDCVLGKEGMYNVEDLRHVLLVRIKTLKKKIVVLTPSLINVNPVRVLRCDLYGEGHQNVHGTP